MTELVFPVGHQLGPYFPGDSEDPDYYEVCIGRTTYGLPTDEGRVWLLAHGRPGETPLTWPEYRRILIGSGIADVAGVAGRLANDGLLQRVPDTGEQAVAFARRHRIMPMATAIGNAGEGIPDGRYALGMPGHPFMYADDIEYWLWLWSPVHDSLAHACDELATSQAGVDRADGDPHTLLPLAMAAVQALIAHQMAFLDASWDTR